MTKKLIAGMILLTVLSEAKIKLELNQDKQSVLINWEDEQENPSLRRV